VPQGENKLAFNQKAKGQNSYYYAHTPRDAPKVVGDVTPQKSTSAPELAKKLDVPFENYSWSNSKKTVSIYISYPDAADIDDDSLSISSTARSVDFRVVLKEGPKVLKLTKLQHDIKGVTVKKKADKFQIVLEKADEDQTWYRLVSV